MHLRALLPKSLEKLTWLVVSWDQFARDWNRPVHVFLLRHVYHSSISSMKVNKHTATLITFFLSACVHELVMWCLFKKLRGYLLILQMCQLPVSLPILYTGQHFQFTDVTMLVGKIKSHKVAQRTKDFGKFHILVGYFHRPESALQSLPDPLSGRLRTATR